MQFMISTFSTIIQAFRALNPQIFSWQGHNGEAVSSQFFFFWYSVSFLNIFPNKDLIKKVSFYW